ncbi:MAG TPA: ATP-binding cassette domain-containing protein [Anaerolineales bacterium]|nr:ATP-binding cassette domain-containing protein [Anaerolineales bacterium]
MQPIITVSQVSKCYPIIRIREKISLSSIIHALRPPKQFWALQNISFRQYPGEVVGLIGANGAGKSTLLQIISRVTKPTSGYTQTTGRTAALLQAAVGFHNDLSGRENVFLAGALIGENRREMEKRFDDIVSFANLAEYIDWPVKRYSSGMRLRLGLAVALLSRPEILIVDEALTVGDHKFRVQVRNQILQLKKDGCSMLLVSHESALVQALCNRVLWLEKGYLKKDGLPQRVLSEYLSQSLNLLPPDTWQSATASESRTVFADWLGWRYEPGAKQTTIWLDIEVYNYSLAIVCELVINTTLGNPLAICRAEIPQKLAQHGKMRLKFELNTRLLAGFYMIDFRLYDNQQLQNEIKNAFTFEVPSPTTPTELNNSLGAVVELPAQISYHLL